MSDHQINFTGCALFVISTAGFFTAHLRHFRAMFGSLFLLVACLIYLIPVFPEPQQ
ncbi:cytochrome oxidase subunit III [Roseovarius sp. M141]|nr:cytochrome oxidase subunit III [Roseovarius sp. M141]